MVNTRSQTTENKPINMKGIDRHSDAESEDSVPEVLTREQISEFDNGSLFDSRSETKRCAVN